MNVLLVNPSQKGVYGKLNPPEYPPMGLAYIGAVLEKEGHFVKIVDINADKIQKNQLVELFKAHDFVGLTATTPTFKSAESICKLVKKTSSAKTILGGIHATISSEECAKSNSIDFVIRGEGEETIVELLNAIKTNSDLKKSTDYLSKKITKLLTIRQEI